MVARRREDVIWCWVLAATWPYLPCFSSPFTGTTAAHWTLYSGLSLSWNEASMFCKSVGGSLPVLNTWVKYNSFNATATKWNNANLVSQDIWTGLFSTTPNVAANVWEGNCLAHPDWLTLWGVNEPDNTATDFCVRYKLGTGRLHTWPCSGSMSVVCEFDADSCHYRTTSGWLPKLQRNESLNGTTMDCCWEQCMKYPPTATGQECVGAVFSLGKCTGYVGDNLVFALSATANLSATTMVKECFVANVNLCYNHYSYVDQSSKPRPAGNPCRVSSSSFLPIVPISTCIQTSTPASTQSQRAKETTILVTREQSSEKLETKATWPLTDIFTPKVSETSATLTVSGSTLLEDASQTSQSDWRPTTERAAAIARSVETTVEMTSNERTEKLTTDTDLFSDGINGSLPENVLSTRGSRRILCSCMNFNPNVSAWLPAMHRHNTSRYRRSHNSQWGSPSVYTSTCSATFVIVVGVAGFLFVVCDINRFTGPRDKRRRESVERLSA